MGLVVLALLSCVRAGAAEPPGAMVRFDLDGVTIEGSALRWNEQVVHLLARDGRLWEFPPQEATNYHTTATRFQAYSASAFRAVLLRELGSGYQVSGTTHYLVAHPKGQRTVWPDRFEQLYRTFVGYLSVRGLALETPLYPLVGIVCRNRTDFDRFSRDQGHRPGSAVSGYYSRATNRIVVYDQDGAASDASRWRETFSTVIHEATHQTAFNTGVHNRFSETPLWVAEGLATLFEARGVHDANAYPHRTDRVNDGRLRGFRALLADNHRPELLQSLVASDQFFRAAPGAAYCESWALMFYLSETQSGRLADYLRRTASHASFESVGSAKRLADFTAVFGDDWRMLEARFLRFLASLP